MMKKISAKQYVSSRAIIPMRLRAGRNMINVEVVPIWKMAHSTPQMTAVNSACLMERHAPATRVTTPPHTPIPIGFTAKAKTA
jgi:hypothetical protein